MNKPNASAKKIEAADGASIAYDVASQKTKKPWVILLHGLGGSLVAWDAIREDLHSHGYSTIAIDLRGHGHSDRSSHKSFYSFANYAQDVIGVLKQEKITDPILVGHCFGGMVAQEVALTSTTLKHLVLINTSYKLLPSAGHLKSTFLRKLLNEIVKFTPNVRLQNYEDFSKFIGTTDYDLKRIASDILHTAPKSYLYMIDSMFNFDRLADLQHISTPTLVLAGKKDTVFPPSISATIAQTIPHATLQTIDGNHIMVINHPEAVTNAIVQFLTKHEKN